MEEFIGAQVPLLFVIAAIAVVGIALLIATICMEPYRRVRRAALSADSEDRNDENLPSISLVVHAEGDDYVLTEFLDSVLKQDYDDFEVIVVNDASAAATAVLAERFVDEPRLYFTFIPPGSQVLSRHKMALTIGIKGAKKDIIMTTTAHARPLSTNWLREMTLPFVNDKRCGAVLGTAEPDFSCFPAGKRRCMKLCYSTRAARWISAALDGRAYGGSGYNLAFRKKLFFSNKGYSKGILLEGGEDDLFIENIAKTERVVAAPQKNARVMMDWGASTPRLHKNDLIRHRESGKLLEYRGRNIRVQTLVMNIFLLAAATLMALSFPTSIGFSLPTIISWASAAFIVLATFIYEAVVLSKLSNSLTDNKVILNDKDYYNNNESFNNSNSSNNSNPPSDPSDNVNEHN